MVQKNVLVSCIAAQIHFSVFAVAEMLEEMEDVLERFLVKDVHQKVVVYTHFYLSNISDCILDIVLENIVAAPNEFHRNPVLVFLEKINHHFESYEGVVWVYRISLSLSLKE